MSISQRPGEIHQSCRKTKGCEDHRFPSTKQMVTLASGKHDVITWPMPK